MLNKCQCGANAMTAGQFGIIRGVMCSSWDCRRVAYGTTNEMMELEWNNQNPNTPTDDFQKRFDEAFRGITQLMHDDVEGDQVLAEFKSNFGFDLKEVAKEQWAKGVRHDG